MGIQVRLERAGDIERIRAITASAFSSSDLGHHGEAELIDRLRASCPRLLSLVAEVDGRVVGHILFSPAVIEGEGESAEGMGLAPMAVAPEFQGRGIGGALVTAGLERLRSAGCAVVIVLGHPEFYAKYGFHPASEFGITCEFEAPADVFRVAVLGDVEPPQGVARFRAEFHET